MRYAPGANAEFDAQMAAIARLPAEARLAWREERRRTMWELASDRTRARWIAHWLANPHYVRPEDIARARVKARVDAGRA